MRRLLAAAVRRIGRRGQAPDLPAVPEPETLEPDPDPDPDPDLAIVSGAFDSAFYLNLYADVAEAGVDPLEHFMAFGWREGRDPSPEFSTRAYLAAYPEVATSGANPFAHYLANGRPRILPPESPLGFRFELIEKLAPIEERIARVTASPILLDDDSVLSAALAQSRGGLACLHITVSHDDFTANVGGLQLGLQREAARLADLGRDHLHLYPAQPWPVVRTSEDEGAFGVVWNGEAVGVFSPEAVRDSLSAAGTGTSRTFAIHSLLGHAADEVADVLEAAGLTQGVFWLHDFASLCAGFHLQRNDVEDCAAPPPDSAACAVCLYGPWRARHMAAHARLFERLKLTVAAPSQVTLDLWRASTDLPAAAAVVLPHARLVPRGAAPITGANRPLRVAYAGFPIAHKGWPIFRSLAARFAPDARYDFVHLGARRDPELTLDFIPVSGGPADPMAMLRALEAAEVDVAFIWPLCRETFSFVAYEAVAAGCAIITGPDSGNVQAFVADAECGRVLNDETALIAAFESGEILELARAQRRPLLYDLAFSALTLDLPELPTT